MTANYFYAELAMVQSQMTHFVDDVSFTVPLHRLVEPVSTQAPLLPVITLPRGQSLGKTADLQNPSKLESLYEKEKAVERSSETGVSSLK